MKDGNPTDSPSWKGTTFSATIPPYLGTSVLSGAIQAAPDSPWNSGLVETLAMVHKLLLLFSGGTRNAGAGGKMHLENAKIPKFAKNGWFLPFFLLPGVQGWQIKPPTGKMLHCPFLCHPDCCIDRWILLSQCTWDFFKYRVMDCLLWPSSLYQHLESKTGCKPCSCC